MAMSEEEILEFTKELSTLIDRFDPNENPATERVLSVMLLSMSVATAAGGERTREEFLQECATRWDEHWRLFNETKSRKDS